MELRRNAANVKAAARAPDAGRFRRGGRLRGRGGTVESMHACIRRPMIAGLGDAAGTPPAAAPCAAAAGCGVSRPRPLVPPCPRSPLGSSGSRSKLEAPRHRRLRHGRRRPHAGSGGARRTRRARTASMERPQHAGGLAEAAMPPLPGIICGCGSGCERRRCNGSPAAAAAHAVHIRRVPRTYLRDDRHHERVHAMGDGQRLGHARGGRSGASRSLRPAAAALHSPRGHALPPPPCPPSMAGRGRRCMQQPRDPARRVDTCTATALSPP